MLDYGYDPDNPALEGSPVSERMLTIPEREWIQTMLTMTALEDELRRLISDA